MNKFKDLIYNREVAIVGPAKYMLGSSLGKEIDGHDVVIRINRSVETTSLYPKDIGLRTDILYSCLIETYQNAGKTSPQDLYDIYGVQHIVAPPFSDFSGVSHSTRLHHMVNRDTVRDIERLMSLRIVPHDFHTKLAAKVRSRPNTGFLAIYDLLSFQPSKLSIYGFSFYLDGFIPGCKSGIEKEKNVSEDGFADLAFNSKRHVQKNMWSHAKQTLLESPIVSPDPILQKILNLESLDKDLFREMIKNEDFYSNKGKLTEGS